MSIQTKHLINSAASLVLDSLEGLCAANSQLALDSQNKVVYIASQDRSKVAIVCGGGSGHEPAHAGFVGKGILTAAVCGSVFASPNASQVRRGISIVDNDQGTLIIVKNYTGDVLNFGLAKEQYAASHPGKASRVKFLVVGDDVSVGKTQGSIVGRRGLAGTVVVYKIAGAMADRGASLDDVYSIAEWVASRIGTIGVGLEHCHIPGTATSSSHLRSDEIEIGMGIHNESGTKRLSPVPSLQALIPQVLELLTNTADEQRSFLPFQGGNGKDDVVLLVNNLGGISELELGGILAETRRALDTVGINIHRVLCGTFMTSLNMPGFSISLLLLPTNETSPSMPSRELILSLLDAPTETPGWKWTSHAVPTSIPKILVAAAPSSTNTKQGSVILKSADPKAFTQSIERVCKAIIEAEPEITRMDTIAGDGDCGTTLAAGANGVLKMISNGVIHGNDVVASIIAVSQVAEEAMGGTSGALYSIFFSALAQGLQNNVAKSVSGAVTLELWSLALTSALANLYTYTRARKPSRTLVDPLSAFVESCHSLDFTAAVKGAAAAAEDTVNVDAKAGRSAYVESDRLKEEKVPDPGAWGVKVILESLNL